MTTFYFELEVNDEERLDGSPEADGCVQVWMTANRFAHALSKVERFLAENSWTLARQVEARAVNAADSSEIQMADPSEARTTEEMFQIAQRDGFAFSVRFFHSGTK